MCAAPLEAGADARPDTREPTVLVPPSERARRPRWADLNSDSDTELVLRSVAARAPCARCHQSLTKASFSRRAWRQVRGKGAFGDRKSDSACCRQCTEDLSK
eukprot:Skav200098  [mRNA]  locus=scaffold694:494547:501097:- [translate_table: standard]